MTVTTVDRKQTTKESKRCPVLKIDLKGQFVNVDDLTSELLGLPPENLFGRNIKEFLDKDSYRGLVQIIQYGNRFDACYEAIELLIIDNNKKQQKLNAIVSLNFIAGNPSNYQIILLKSNRFANGSDNVAESSLTVKRLFELSSDFARNSDWKKLAELLIKNLNINQIGIYKYDDATLSLLADASKQKSKNQVDLSLTDENHLQAIADNQQTCSPKINNKESEYSYPLKFNNSCWGLLRCIVKDELCELEGELALIAGYIGPVFGIYIRGNSQNEDKVAESQTNFFEILKLFGCTAISFDTDGNILSSYSDFPDKNHILAGCTNISELTEQLSKSELIGLSGEGGFEISLSDGNPIVFPDLGVISNKTKFYLYKILCTRELSGGLAEYTIVLFPEFDNSIGRKTIDKLLGMFLETAGIFLEPIDKCAAKMAGQFYPRLNNDGRFYIDTIQDNCQVLYRTISRFKELCKIVNRKENPTEINITEIIIRAIKDFQNKKNELKITLDDSGQVFLVADVTRITEALNAIFTGLISQTVSDENPAIGIKVTAENDSCRIQIISFGKLEKSFDVNNALEPLASIKEIPLSGLTVFENELPIARLLIESMGGQMELSKSSEKEIIVAVTLLSIR